MKRMIGALLALLWAAGPALADPSGAVLPGTLGTQSWLQGCVYHAGGITASDGQQMAVSCDASGNLLTTGGGGGGGGGTSSNFGSAFPTAGTAVGFKTGSTMAPGNLDGSGNILVNVAAGGAGGGAVYGPTAVGSAAANPPVLMGGTADGTATGLVSVAKVVSGIVQVANTAATPAGSNVIGHVIADTGSTTAATQATAANLNATVVGTGTFATQSTVTQATAASLNATVVGTGTFAVQNTAATPAGANLIGKVGIDQTTPGTTNGVQVNAALPAGANVIGHVINDASSAVIGHVIADTGSTTAATQATAANLNATVVGTGTFAVQNAQGDGTQANAVSGTTAAMTGTTSTSLVASPGGSLHNYILNLTCVNSHATVGTFVTVQDGSGGTALYTLAAASLFGGSSVTFPFPGLRQPTAATALFVADVTTGANVICSASGYKGS